MRVEMTERLSHLPFETDAGAGARARLGLIALATDYSAEPEYHAVLAALPGVALYVARIPMAPEVTTATLAAMETEIPRTAALLLPGEDFGAIAYGCSSATSVLGEARIEALVRQAKPGAAVTNPISAARAALSALGARRIGVLTPYTADVNAQIERAFTGAGFEIAVFGSFDEPVEARVGRISPDAIAAAARRVAGRARSEALFISCTNLRALGVIEDLEAGLGIPVTSSNHAMIWHTLRLAGVADRLPGLGRLFQV